VASNDSDLPVPTIGVTTYLQVAKFGNWDSSAVVLPRTYADNIRAVGGNPVHLSPIGDWRAATVGWLDGLVLAGGADIDPARYGAERHPMTGPAAADRDESELALFAAALELDIPVLGVCRGMQLMNVALGGTLCQHTPEQVGSTLHLVQDGVFGTVPVTSVPGTLFAKTMQEADAGEFAGEFSDEIPVSCHHHQSLDRLAEGLTVSATGPDGCVEAVELAGRSFVLGVQSHPEQGGPSAAVFGALVQAARERMRG
jgi:gamma-glutamyl-gamma-aminobutyrate hydrolase PuuD